MKTLPMLLVLFPLVACAQADARVNFMQQQAFAEMQRVTGEVNALQGDVEDLRNRVRKVEASGNGEAALRAEIDSLKNAISELRQAMANQRAEIIRDLSGRLAKLQAPVAATPPKQVAVNIPTSTYTVQNGDSLYLIAKAFGTTVAKLKELNSLKNDNLKIGQKLLVPQE